jgi:hypothetical protein
LRGFKDKSAQNTIIFIQKGVFMKLAHLSLATLVMAGLTTNSFAADTLADAFKNGQLGGELRAYYFDRAGDPNRVASSSTSLINSSLFSTGVDLKYVTDSFNGFKLGMTIQSSYSPFADGAVGKAGTAKGDFSGDEYGSGAVFSEAYIQYTLDKTVLKVGRQYIATPLVAGSPSRMVAQSFEGATLTNTNLPDTTIMAGVITKYQSRTDNAGGIAQFGILDTSTTTPDTEHNHGYTLFVSNKSVPNTTITAQWAGLDTNDAATVGGDVDWYYGEINYKIPVNDFTYGLAVNTEYKSATLKSDGVMYGAMASLGYKDFNTYAAYSVITDKGDIYGISTLAGGIGGGSQTTFAHGYQNKFGIFSRDTKVYSYDANYNFKNIGLLVGARYTGADDNYLHHDYGYTDIYTVYTVQALKGLVFDVSYQDWSRDVDGHDFWFKAIYKF